jgi:LppP/LprE lipoprotein
MESSGDRQLSGAERSGSPPLDPWRNRCRARQACHTREPDDGTVRDVWSIPCPAEPLTTLSAAVLIGATLTGCGSGDSTVAKTPQAMTNTSSAASAAPSPSGTAAPPSSSAPPADPCAVNLASPTIAKVVSELPRDPRSEQTWNPEPLAGNYNECAQLSAVIIKANTNANNPTTRAVLFHLGQFIPQGVPDTYGFNGIDTSQSTGDIVALTYPGGINGLSTPVRFHWNGNTVELIGNTLGR